MSEELRCNFRIKGLTAPVEELAHGNIKLRGLASSDEAILSLLVPISGAMSNEKAADDSKREVENIIQVYGLITNHPLEILSSTCEKILNGAVKELTFTIKVIPTYNEEVRKKKRPIIEKTLKKYVEIQEVFSSKSKFFLRNAIDYFARSLKDVLLEEKLLDLMIALESLFSNEQDELSYRYSLRASSLLSIGQTKYSRLEIYGSIRDLYNKRSLVVHGVKKVELDNFDVLFLQENVREAIKRLLYIEMPKGKIIELLDASILDENYEKVLIEKVLEAIAKW